MAKKTFLEHIQMFAREVGFSDRGPTTVIDQSIREFQILIDQWNHAYVYIQTKWSNWRFMWAQYSQSTTIDDATYYAPSDLNNWDKDTFQYDGNELIVYEYEEIKTDYDFSTESSTPHTVIIMPDNSLKLDPPPDTVKTLTADYYKTAERLTLDDDVSRLPASYEDAIVWLAMTFWGDFQESPFFKEAGLTRYRPMMSRLEANQLPGNMEVDITTNNDIRMVVE